MHAETDVGGVQDTLGRLIGEGLCRLRRNLRTEHCAEERQAVDAHHAPDRLGMLLRQQKPAEPAHGMADDGGTVERRRIARQLVDGGLDERAVAVGPRLAGEPGQLHQMHPMGRRQAAGQRPPDLARGGEAGDQDNVRPLPHDLDRQAVGDEGGRLANGLGLGRRDDARRAEADGGGQDEGAQSAGGDGDLGHGVPCVSALPAVQRAAGFAPRIRPEDDGNEAK
ncbi:hypothetical protein D3C73_935760 [compost metagenome]